MGSAEESTRPNPKTTATTAATTPPPPAAPPVPSQEVPSTPSYSSDWVAHVKAFYDAGAGASPQAFLSMWGGQHIISPYGTPIPYSPVYHHGPLYAHPSMAMPTAYTTTESGNDKSKGGSGKSGDGGRVTSGSADEYASQSAGESGSEGTSDTRDDSADPQDGSRKRLFSDALGEGDNSQPITAAQNNGTTAESSYSGRGRTAKLPVSAPGRSILPGPATNLNIGMDLWSASSHAGTGPMTVRPNSVNIASTTVGANGVMPERHRDERELKRERRKQSNRESARRSRLRKQQECEELARKVSELNSDNSALKNELEQLNKACEDLEAENASIQEELTRILGGGAVAKLEGVYGNSSSITPPVNGEGGGRAPQIPVGSNEKIYASNGNF